MGSEKKDRERMIDERYSCENVKFCDILEKNEIGNCWQASGRY